ncbi:MAG: aldehyde dehydrogenase family protein [Anaerolineales bacterium]|nr:aldehyde dehydrogenase family protein [Anaerolineales bacterium]
MATVKGKVTALGGNIDVLPFINPATGEQFGEVPIATPGDISMAHREMMAAGQTWAAKSVKERVRIVKQLQKLIIDRLDEITAVMNQDGGKSRQDALTELFMSVDLINAYCKNAPKWLRRRRISSGLQIFKHAYQELTPYGVVGIIGPWNYPFVLLIPPIVSALLAGNTVLAKPSEVTAATGVMMEELIQAVPELSPYVRFLHGDGRVGAALVQCEPDLIFLTGSTKTGKLVMKAAAESMTPVICELGGKDPMIVLEDADIQAAAKWGVWGSFYNTGQTCMAVERVYVVNEVYDAFIKEAVATTRQLKIGYSPERLNENDIGPLTFQRQIDIVDDQLDDALAKGARTLTGGKRDGMFMEPTIVVDVDHTMKIMQEETFGPLMPIMRVDNELHAIQLANHSNFGLSASVWSQDLKRAKRVAEQLIVGSVNINDTMTHFAIPHLPFGGVKDSGIGRTHSEKDMLQFTQSRSIVVGKPPLKFDIATIMRQPGQYKLASAILRIAFGVTPQQRLQPVQEFIEEKAVKPKTGRFVAVAGTMAAVSAFIITWAKLRKH